MARCSIYLVPGFFGFTSLGAYSYFYRVAETLEEYLKETHGVDADVIECKTQPTASIRNRADFLLQEVLDSGGLDADAIHFVGHSMGGLDVRLLVTPGVRLRPDMPERAIGEKTKSVTTISTPHFGTPLAGFFTTFQGRHILRIMTTLAGNGVGRQSLFWGAQMLSFVASLDDWMGRKDTFLDHLARRMLRRMTLDPDDPIWRFLEEMSSDQGAIIQLTPEGMHLYNAAVVDREGVQYSSVITAVPPPGARMLGSRITQPQIVGTTALFYFLHTITGREHKHYPYPSPAEKMWKNIEKELPFPLDTATNDGVAPTLSQVYGDLLHVDVADHLDVVGQFSQARNERYTDWMTSGADYDEACFQRTWKNVGDAIVRSMGPEKCDRR